MELNRNLLNLNNRNFALIEKFRIVENRLKVCFIRRILVASNTIKALYNEMINLIKLHYLLFELHSTRPKFDV